MGAGQLAPLISFYWIGSHRTEILGKTISGPAFEDYGVASKTIWENYPRMAKPTHPPTSKGYGEAGGWEGN